MPANIKTYSTESVAISANLHPGSLRNSFCRKGHWCGIRPAKLPNGRLLWPADQIDALLTGEPQPKLRAVAQK